MTIVKIKDRHIELGMTEPLIEDIGLGGLRFLSNIKLPVNPEIIIEFETEILERDELAPLLNDLSIQIRNTPLVPHCRFIKMDSISYIKNLK
jgi:hypothetical protein